MSQNEASERSWPSITFILDMKTYQDMCTLQPNCLWYSRLWVDKTACTIRWINIFVFLHPFEADLCRPRSIHLCQGLKTDSVQIALNSTIIGVVRPSHLKRLDFMTNNNFYRNTQKCVKWILVINDTLVGNHKTFKKEDC
jgi:hypothetical protein